MTLHIQDVTHIRRLSTKISWIGRTFLRFFMKRYLQTQKHTRLRSMYLSANITSVS